jgi:Predicted transcription factor, homolog of eukaryotic MBF1
MGAKVLRFKRPTPPPRKPYTFTENEAVVEVIREAIFASGRSYKEIADECGLGDATVGRLARGETKWPQPRTLFPLLRALGLQISIGRG